MDGQSFDEVAHLNTDMEKYGPNLEAIYGKKERHYHEYDDEGKCVGCGFYFEKYDTNKEKSE